MEYSIRATKQTYRKIPLVLRSLGLHFHQETVLRENGMPVWQIFLGVSGSGIFRIDGRQHILRRGFAMLLPPDAPHSYYSENSSEDWIVHFLGFSGNSCQKLLADLGLFQAGLYRIKQDDPCFAHLEEMSVILTSRDPDQNRLLSGELYSFLLDFAGQSSYVFSPFSDQSPGLVQDMTRYMEEHYAEDLSLTWLGEVFHKSPEYLCSCFKQETGMTPMNYLTRIRIGRAKWLMAEDPQLTVREIGKRCGYHSASYFGSVFRRQTGMTPMEYMKVSS